MHPTLTIALRAAEALSDRLQHLRKELAQADDEGLSPKQIISQAMDDAAFRSIRILRNAYPDQRIEVIGRPEALHEPEHEARSSWYIDILQGESDFARGGNHCSTLIYQKAGDKVQHVCITFPFLDVQYTATAGRGAQKNDHRIRLQARDSINGGVVQIDELLTSLAVPTVSQGASVRITGNAMLDHCLVAEGVADAAITHTVDEHEAMALALLLQESGALTGAMTGAPLRFDRPTSLVSGGKRPFMAAVQLAKSVS